MFTYWRASLVESAHGDFETGSLAEEDILFRHQDIFESDTSGVRCSLAHVNFLIKRNIEVNNCLAKFNKMVVHTFRPGVSPGVSRSTMKPVRALLAGAFGSGFVRAKTKYQFA